MDKLTAEASSLFFRHQHAVTAFPCENLEVSEGFGENLRESFPADLGSDNHLERGVACHDRWCASYQGFHSLHACAHRRI